jgi:hypothetical protein
LEEREEKREEEWTLMQEPALARATRHFERVKGGPCSDKIVYFCSSLLYMLALSWLWMTWHLTYSQQLAILLSLLSETTCAIPLWSLPSMLLLPRRCAILWPSPPSSKRVHFAHACHSPPTSLICCYCSHMMVEIPSHNRTCRCGCTLFLLQLCVILVFVYCYKNGQIHVNLWEKNCVNGFESQYI